MRVVLLLFQSGFLLFLFPLIAVANTSKTMLNSSGENDHPCLVPDFRGNVFSFSPLRIMFVVGLSYMAFIQFSSVSQSCLTLCDPMDCSMPGFPIHHQLLELTQTDVHQVGDAIQQSPPLSSPSPPALNLFQHQGLFQWVSSSPEVIKILEFQLQHQSFQWTLRTDLL